MSDIVKRSFWIQWLPVIMTLVGCSGNSSAPQQPRGLEIKLLFGSALDSFCAQAIERFNQTNPKLQDGQAFYAACEAKGSGDVVTSFLALADRYRSGSLTAEAPEFPTLLSVDGEIYHSQLKYEMDQRFPGESYIPAVTDAPLLAYSPMVWMTTQELAPGLRKTPNLYKVLVQAKTHQDIDPASSPLPIHFVHTAPTRSNSGLQTLVAQYASVSGKRPEELSIGDVSTYEKDITQIQAKVTRYGESTSSLAKSMARHGPFWASLGSVYESLVIRVNRDRQPGSVKFEAVYPAATFSSNMRAILPTAPWISPAEKEAAEQIITFLTTPEIQAIAVAEGLRPGVPGVDLGNQFSPEFGVDPNPKYDSYRSPQPEVVAAMLESWKTAAKKPSRVVVIIDSSGSMKGERLAAAQQTLQTYINNLGPLEEVALIDFDKEIRPPVLIDGSAAGKANGLTFITQLEAEGGTLLYDAILSGQQWLQQNLRPNAINAVLVLTDGEDSGSAIPFPNLLTQLESTGFASEQRIAVFTVGYGEEGDFNPEVLKQIAENNAGYYSKGDPATITQLMDKLQLEF